MTNQNNAAHIAALEDLRLGVEMDRHHLPDGDATISALDAALALLRAPVADERAAFEAAWRELNSPWPMNSRMHDDGRYATPDIEREWRLWQARAALASAPADEPPGCPTYVCQAAQADGVLCANDECDRASGVRPASAPVAGEAQAWMHENDPTRVISAQQKAQAERDGGAYASSLRPYTIPLYLDAAPQASEAVRAGNLECASKLPEVECSACELKVISSCGSKGCPVNDGYAALSAQPGAQKEQHTDGGAVYG